MKKSFILFIINFLMIKVHNGQNLFNPYLIWAGVSQTNSSVSPVATFNNGPIIQNSVYPSGNNSYDGEYETFLVDHFWHQRLWDSFWNSWVLSPFNDFAKSFTIEAVGAPFTISCAFNSGGCASSATTRYLLMPNTAYSSLSNKWDELWRLTPLGTFEKCVAGQSTGSTGRSLNHATLVSTAFPRNYPLNTTDRWNIPHTILKHTLSIHCGPDTTDPIAFSYSFYVDLTRGRMRYYPFHNQNSGTMSAGQYDILIRPYLIIDPFNSVFYNDAGNADWIDNGGTADYFPYSESNSICTQFSNPLSTDYFKQHSILFPDFMFPGPFTLTSAFALDEAGDHLAGYARNGQNIYIDPNYFGIKHDYFIDQNIDLNILNPSEKIIYNPSEVTVTASDLVFPSEYTFKTIRGVYPTATEVATDKNNGTGGLYTDDRFVPVRTDLRCENSNYPQAATPIDNSVYASMYYLESGSKLTVQPCVQIYDAAFEVRPGATLKFEDHPNTLGFEDKSSNEGRYKILGIGGAVLRNYDDVQYIQNGSITQTYPLEYIAVSSIEAGENVDPDGDAAQGNYSLENGSDVTFTAGDYIHLTDGFDVKPGASFSAFTLTGITPPSCSFFANNGSSQYRGALQQSETFPSAEITVQPNPASGKFNLKVTGFSEPCSIRIFNALGKEVYSIGKFDAGNLSVSTETFQSGIYLIAVFDQCGNAASEKLVIQ